MDKWKTQPIRSSEITPEWAYVNRRQFMKGAAALSLGALLAACAPSASKPSSAGPQAAATLDTTPGQTKGNTDELGDPLT